MNGPIDWLLVLSYLCHLLATVSWIGGLLLATALFALAPEDSAPSPASSGVGPYSARWLEHWRQRFYPVANLSLAVLIVTGLYQMGRNSHYQGALQFTNDWSRAMLLKHIAVAGMLGVGAFLQFGVLPALDRANLLLRKGKPAPRADALRRRERQLTILSTALGMLVLALTAIATAL